MRKQPFIDKACGERDNFPRGKSVKQIEIDLDGKKAKGLEVPLPKAPLVVAYGTDGFVMCGYLNVEAADQLGVAAAMVRGVSTVEDLLKAPVQKVSAAAQTKGVQVGVSGQEALSRLI